MDILDMGCAAEIPRERMKVLGNTTLPEVYAVNQKAKRNRCPACDTLVRCFYCLRQYEQVKKKCPALVQQCKECGNLNHFSRGRSKKYSRLYERG